MKLNPNYKLYCLYHDKVFPEYYGDQIDKITFVKMDDGPYLYPALNHIYLQKEKWFHPIGKEWAEYEFYYSLYQGYKKGLIELPEYVGFIQYDMEFISRDTKYKNQTIINFIDSLFVSKKINQKNVVIFHPRSFKEIYSQNLTMDINNGSRWGNAIAKNCLDSIKEDISKYLKKEFNNNFKNQYLALAGAFFVSQQSFIEIMDFLNTIIDSKKLDIYEKQRRMQGHFAERYVAIYIEEMNLEKILFPVKHKKHIIKIFI